MYFDSRKEIKSKNLVTKSIYMLNSNEEKYHNYLEIQNTFRNEVG
jgi:hypothetical protein